MQRYANFLASKALLVAALLCAACATAPAPPDPALELRAHPVVLLGEVHDNPLHHRSRLHTLTAALEGDRTSRYRPALLMEQFDRERQSQIERARREKPGDADHLIALATPAPTRPGGQGWNWSFYKPFVELALRFDLPIVAANLSRADLMKVAQQGFGSVFSATEMHRLGLDRDLPADLVSAQEREIHTGHCGAMPAALLPSMARTQIARDAYMALKIEEHRARSSVLLAGNGHVRRDIGVPRWLSSAGSVYAVGYLEAPADPADRRYHRVVITAPAERPDPCAAFLRSRSRTQGEK